MPTLIEPPRVDASAPSSPPPLRATTAPMIAGRTAIKPRCSTEAERMARPYARARSGPYQPARIAGRDSPTPAASGDQRRLPIGRQASPRYRDARLAPPAAAAAGQRVARMRDGRIAVLYTTDDARVTD